MVGRRTVWMGVLCAAVWLTGGTDPAARASDADKAAGTLATWPVQKSPRGMVQTTFASFHPVGGRSPDLSPEHMLVESIAGLAAAAVNDGRGDEMVWIKGNHQEDYGPWHDDLFQHLHLEKRGSFDPWELLARYRKNGIVKGYILYSFDTSAGNPAEPRPGTDESVNVATSLAGVIGGVLISTDLEDNAKAAGLPLLMDVRGKSPAWCFQNYQSKLNPLETLAQDPKLPFNRDLAIAHRMFVLWGTGDPAPAVFRRMRPGGSVFGWNAGDEGKMVSQMSAYGLTLYPSNWADNLCACAAGNNTDPPDAVPPAKFSAFNPTHLDWNDHHAANAFLLSDGDNVQWLMTTFCHNPDYWASPGNGTFPFAFGIEAASLQQAAPQVLDYLTSTQPANTSIVQASGGYFYPDLFGSELPGDEQDKLLTDRGQQLNAAMHRSNVRVLILYCMSLNSAAARRGFDRIAAQLDDAAGLLAIQYSPYAGGDGRIYWTKDHHGVPLPVVSAKFDIWSDTHQKNTGTPPQVATWINTAAKAAPANEPLLCWTIQHAWSNFGSNASPERGVSPSLDCMHHFSEQVRTVSIEELLWQIRMRHDPAQTKAALADWRP